MMRILMSFLAAAVGATLASTAPAAAKWACSGTAVACQGTSAHTAESNRGQRAATHHGHKRTAHGATRRHRVAHGKSASHRTAASNGGSYSGKASYYWQPQRVASGGWFNPNALTAAHKTLPFGTRVRVTNAHNGRSVVVTINDRGPYVRGRIIDLSRAAAHAISMQGAGVVPVSLTVLGRG